ncbi:MAG: AIR synthase-related protein [Nanoarchaeota archaeon]
MYDVTKSYKDEILKLISTTHETKDVSVKNGIIVKKFNFPEACSTDGVGTKGVYHWQQRSFRNAVLDALAMNLNDLVMSRARAYKLQNHLILPEDDRESILEIIKNFVNECKKRNIAITGGETSIHDNINGMDISVTIDGLIENPRKNKFESGDILVGIKSNGLHSNGFTKVRELYGDEFRPEFIEPTLVYSDALLEIGKKFEIHGMMHITGGAFSKLKGVLGDNDVLIKPHTLKPKNIFYEIYSKGVSDEEMYKTFNCGVGFVLGVSKIIVHGVVSLLNNAGFKSDIIGEVVSGSGRVLIDSAFSEKKVVF